jgi:hypothetical protein
MHEPRRHGAGRIEAASGEIGDDPIRDHDAVDRVRWI